MAGVGKDSAMYQTMQGQPADLHRVLADGWPLARAVGDAVAHARQTWLVGIGTSFHAALAGQWMLREFGLSATAVSSFDFATYPDHYAVSPEDAVILLSHSGARQFSRAAMERAEAVGAPVFLVSGHKAKALGSGIVLRTTAQERSAAFTASHLTAMTVLAQITAGAADVLGSDRSEEHEFAIELLPDQVAEVLARADELEALAANCVDAQTYVVGAGPSEVAALEAVIKCREAAYTRVDALPLEQFIHGPMICLQPDDQLILITAHGAAQTRNAAALDLFAQLGPAVHVVGTHDDLPECDEFVVPRTRETLSPILTTVPMQLLAWHMATLKGLDPDTFRTQEVRFGAAIKAFPL